MLVNIRKEELPACWHWTPSEEAYFMAAKAKNCLDVALILDAWQPGCAMCGKLNAEVLDHGSGTVVLRV